MKHQFLTVRSQSSSSRYQAACIAACSPCAQGSPWCAAQPRINETTHETGHCWQNRSKYHARLHSKATRWLYATLMAKCYRRKHSGRLTTMLVRALASPERGRCLSIVASAVSMTHRKGESAWNEDRREGGNQKVSWKNSNRHECHARSKRSGRGYGRSSTIQSSSNHNQTVRLHTYVASKVLKMFCGQSPRNKNWNIGIPSFKNVNIYSNVPCTFCVWSPVIDNPLVRWYLMMGPELMFTYVAWRWKVTGLRWPNWETYAGIMAGTLAGRPHVLPCQLFWFFPFFDIQLGLVHQYKHLPSFKIQTSHTAHHFQAACPGCASWGASCLVWSENPLLETDWKLKK